MTIITVIKVQFKNCKENLAMIERIEAHASRLILKGMEPQFATSDAIEFYCEL